MQYSPAYSTQLRAEIFLVLWSTEGYTQLYNSLATAAQPSHTLALTYLNKAVISSLSIFYPSTIISHPTLPLSLS